jgi:NAD(P)-dependent dehydrogenase (short-subunit alcohol dehydrogenase family)
MTTPPVAGRRDEGLDRLFDLTGRVAIVTGAGRAEGLGHAIARRLGRQGASVVVSDIDEAALAPGVESLTGSGIRVVGVAGDVTDAATADRAVTEAVNAFGRLDVLVNNAGIWTMRKFGEWSKEDWNRVFDVNTTAPILWMQAAVKQFQRQGSGGSIVNIISTAADMVVHEELLAYEASKAATMHATHGVARRFARDGIRVNNILPGPMETGHGQAPGLAVIGRKADPDEIGRAVAFLAGDAGSFVVGADWRVDGGRWLGLDADAAAQVSGDFERDLVEVVSQTGRS